MSDGRPGDPLTPSGTGLEWSDDDELSTSREQHRSQVASVLTQLPRAAPEDDDDDASSPSVQSTALTTYSSSGLDGLYESSGYTSNGGSSYASSGYSYSYSRPLKTFTGLSNQGATCYMNSLLQSMFMTPEFRQGLYHWTCHHAATKVKEEKQEEEEEEEEEADEDNIPLQLQKLFAKLQLTTQDAISTKALTKSFGWTGADVFQQHDVQELCRVLLDALERSFKGTVNETLVNDLYQGSLKDYVQCCECGYESSRIDNFLDLSLVIRPFGSTEMMKTVEEAIELFLRPEVLNKENQWMCDKCKVKRDAIKGLKFSKLPYILMLQLKRFDFDYATMNRIKLHNKVTFPKYLDMNSYVSDENGGGRGKIARKMSMERHVLEGKTHHKTTEDAPTMPSSPPPTPGLAALGERMHRLPSMDESQPMMFVKGDEKSDNDEEDVDDEDDEDEPVAFDTWSPTFDPEVMIKRSGPHVYELYSVLIHSGSALGGHYYAYIKSLDTGKWYNFNDSNVSEISDTELQTAFGGASGSGYSMRYSTCAYMLLYRLVNADKNVNVILPESIPQYLKDKIRADEDKIRRLEQERIEMAKKVQVKFFMKGSKPKNLEKAIYVYKTATIREALEIACKEFAKEKDVVLPAIENVRLRGYNDYNCLLSDTYDDKKDMTLSSLGIYAGQQMFLEVKSDNEEWEDHDPTKLQLFVRRFVDPESDNAPSGVFMARCVQVDEDANVGSLCALITKKFSIPAGRKVRLIKKSSTTYSISAAKVLNANEDERTLNLRLKMDLHLMNGTELYFEETADLAVPSPAEAFFEREANMITVNFKYLTSPAEPIRIDRRETIRTLKEQISVKIGLPSNKFKILRGINSAGVEIKAIDSTLSKLSIGSNHTVFALEGTPLNTGEYNFRLMFYNPMGADSPSPESGDSNNQDQPSMSSADGSDDLFDIDEVLVATGKDDSLLTFVSQIVISEEMLVEDIRKRVWNELVEKDLVNADDGNLSPSYVRLRDLRQSTMTSVLVDGQKLVEASKLAVYEGRSIVAELLPEPETSEVSHRIVEFAYVDRAKWRFVKNKRREVVISTVEEEKHAMTYLADAASAALSIPAERLAFARIPYHRDSIDILEVVSYEFEPAAMFAHKEAEYQELFLVIDTAVQMEYMHNHERQLIQNFLTKKSEEKTRALRAKYSSASSSSNNYQYHKPKEAALVIRTRSRTSEKEHKGGSIGSSNGKNSNGVSIRTPTRRAEKAAARHHASSDTDDEDDTDYITEKSGVEMDLFGDPA
ncbi:Ubiquitin carboxyl-terminal hydrolase 47 [Phytophthora rubi]|uniref:Ubiquitin carboxyl-terminal hydrolase 47 n=1 Tax=Phytophthora rubi TaxID=129364 RepID=A0A6A3MWL9_9STRA|nr:Ubiquitin carboxyl-terminal hydrolase 47 [Phytophthora rubi]KAE9036110.1 Ubiquitin carboxyl-terminal hydrolase 47 [Phytophthora rubi]KAE9345139.1 Ubiquitin carboxyl-terminal hydrolase 47 [Phytophthora rubi]